MIVVNCRFLTQPITGVQRFGVELSLYLKKNYAGAIQFVSPQNIEHREIGDLLGVKVIGNKTGHFWEQIDLPIYLNKLNKPLLLNLANTAPVFYSNKISTIHDVAYLVYPDAYSKTFRLYYNFLIPKILNSSKHIVTVSNFSKTELRKFYRINSEQISVIYNGVHPQFTYTYDSSLSKENYFLTVASLNQRKNFIATIEAFTKFNTENNNFKLFIIGDIESMSFKNIDITSYLSNKSISFLGRVSDSDLVKYYSNAKCFIYPSFYEGFGIPPLESQACSCPVILSNTSCFPEVFSHSVCYCDPYSIESIVDSMNKITSDSEYAKLISSLGHENSMNFSWDNSGKVLLSLLENFQKK